MVSEAGSLGDPGGGGVVGGRGEGGGGKGRPFGDEMFSRSRDLWRQEML